MKGNFFFVRIFVCLACAFFADVQAGYPQDATENQRYTTVLTIAGSDPSGGAGIQADLKTFSALRCYGMSAITALTAQNTVGVQAIHSLPSGFIKEQLASVFDDIAVDAIKIGMLEREEIIQEVALFLQTYKQKLGPIVVDPVMFAKSGHQLIKAEAIRKLKDEILPLATVITPNIHEACALLQIPLITTKLGMEKAAFSLLELGPKAVVLKGSGHPDLIGKDCLVVKEDNYVYWLDSPNITTKNVHGTGCTFSAAIAAFLARGESVHQSVQRAKLYITKAITDGAKYNMGNGKGPVFHFHSVWTEGFVQKVWAEADSLYKSIKNLPFILDLSAGLLDKEKFNGYMGQDCLFLLDRSRAFSILAQRATDPKVREYLDQLAQTSCEAAGYIFEKYDVIYSRSMKLKKAPICDKYTQEMLQKAEKASFNEALVFLLPCALLYQKIGEHLSRIAFYPNQYQNWIDNYSSFERREKIIRFIDLIDRLVTLSSPEELELLKKTFHKAIKYEHDFWQEAYFLRG